ncbi:MAG: hypothetical protein H7838_00050 [Magnetococcus sp. DMHC-8]
MSLPSFDKEFFPVQRFYASRGASLRWTTDRELPVPADFGDSVREYDLLMEQAAWVDFSHMGMVSLSGPEHVAFLGGLTTNQVCHVAASRSLYSALLTPQGRYLWDFTLVAHGADQEPPGLLLITEPDRVPALLQQLAFYRLRAKVQITDERSRFGLLGLIGPAVDQALGALFPGLALAGAAPGATFAPEPGMRLWRDPRQEKFGWRLLLPVDRWSSMEEQLVAALAPAGWTAWEACRIRHALPRGGNEWIPDETLPLEAGLLEMNGVDFGKGCYVGQETTTRTHHRGTIKRRLFRLTGPAGVAWAAGTTVQRPDGKVAGMITSSCSQTGASLALLQLADVAHAQGTLFVQAHPMVVDKPAWAGWA